MVQILCDLKYLKDTFVKISKECPSVINVKNIDKDFDKINDISLDDYFVLIIDNFSFRTIEKITRKGFKKFYIIILLNPSINLEQMKKYFDKLHFYVKNKKIELFYEIVSLEHFNFEESIKNFFNFVIDKISIEMQNIEIERLPMVFIERLKNIFKIKNMFFFFFNPFNEVIKSFGNGNKKNLAEIFKKKIILSRSNKKFNPIEIVKKNDYNEIFLFSHYNYYFIKTFSLVYFEIKNNINLSIILFFLNNIQKLVDFISNKLLVYYKLKKNIEEIKIIYDVSVSLGFSTSVDELISLIVKKAKNVFKADVATLMLLDGNELYVRYSVGLPEIYKNSKQKIGQGIAGKVALTGKPLIVNDIDIIKDKIESEKDYKSSIVVPLKLKNEVIIGTLSVSKISFYPFSEEDLKTLYNLASVAAISLEKARLYQNINLYSEKLEKSYINTIRSLAKAFEARDKYNKGHMERVLKYGLAIASEIDPQLLNDEVLKLSLLFHDIGKIEIPDFILNKPAKLTSEEYEIIKRHPDAGEEILRNVKFLSEVAKIVKQHQERWDGKGYPLGLKGEEIHFYARIVALADAFDAMTSDRVYRKAMSLEEAVEEIKRNRGTQFDPLVVDAFLRAVDNGLIKIEEKFNEELE
ncbi:MAG: HD domain-containing phosphohydrolase, partial [bacterium]